jgi:hypothetical protein
MNTQINILYFSNEGPDTRSVARSSLLKMKFSLLDVFILVIMVAHTYYRVYSYWK